MPATRGPDSVTSGVDATLVVPVYRNAGTIVQLVDATAEIAATTHGRFEAVYVIDGSPDNSEALLRRALAAAPFSWQVIRHSRNFGAFQAIRTGLAHGRGERFAVMAADLQEPPELAASFLDRLATGEVDVVVGVRATREDSSLGSSVFWRFYRRFIQPDMPRGGVDMFGCTRQVRDALIALEEDNSSLVAQLFWLGYRREEVPYHRRGRADGISGWTFKRKLRYLEDSVFSFTDLPIKLLWRLGLLTAVGSIVLSAVIVVARLTNQIDLPGYATTLLVILAFATLNSIGLGIIGSYVWRAYENTKQRPLAVVSEIVADGDPSEETDAPVRASSGPV